MLEIEFPALLGFSIFSSKGEIMKSLITVLENRALKLPKSLNRDDLGRLKKIHSSLSTLGESVIDEFNFRMDMENRDDLVLPCYSL